MNSASNELKYNRFGVLSILLIYKTAQFDNVNMSNGQWILGKKRNLFSVVIFFFNKLLRIATFYMNLKNVEHNDMEVIESCHQFLFFLRI